MNNANRSLKIRRKSNFSWRALELIL